MTLALRTAALAAVLLIGCSSPNDIVFGPAPLQQMAERPNDFARLPEADRALLREYLTAIELGRVLGAGLRPASGRTVGEVLAEARAWRAQAKK
jgi:hypothetical protein